MLEDKTSRLRNQAYFSKYHVARDFVGGVSTFTFFLAVAYAIDSNISTRLDTFASFLKDAELVELSIAIIVAHFLIGYVLGIVGNGLTVGISNFVPIKRIRNLVSYSAYYANNQYPIDEYYERRFSECVAMGSGNSLDNKVSILVDYFEHINQSGYTKVSRLYAIASIYRQVFFYTFVLLVLQLVVCPVSSVTASILGLTLVVCFLKLANIVRITAEAQLRFIVTSEQLWKDRLDNPSETTTSSEDSG